MKASELVKPPRLKPGDKVALISPSNPVKNRLKVVQNAIANFENLTGLEVVIAKNALNQHYYASDTRERRLDDFHWAASDPDIKAVLFSVGGSVALDMIEHIDYDLVARNPKVYAGISDGTTLLTPITLKTGMITFLGLEFLQYADYQMDYQVDSLKKAWFEGQMGEIRPNSDWKDFKGAPNSYKGWRTIQEGAAEGRISGGNGTCFGYYLNTDWQPDLDGKIMVFESYKMPKRSIHRLLRQYQVRGAFEKISGLIIGYCVGADDPEVVGNDKPFAELVIETVDRPDIPIMQVGEIGHHVANIMLPIGARARLDASKKEFEILEKTIS